MTLTLPSGQIDADLEQLRAGAVRWMTLPLPEKASLLRTLLGRVERAAAAWAQAAAHAKGIAGTPLEGEEWISGPWAVLYALNRYAQTLDQIHDTGRPQIDPRRIRTRPGGQVVVDVFPTNVYDRLLLRGIRAEVWMQPGVTPEQLASTLGTWYQEAEHAARVALVLGAGNISSIAPLDVLHKLLADGAVCMLKLNPVNEYLGPIFEEAFAPLVEGGYLRFVYGGAEIGKYLCAHRAVDEIHVTGSEATHNAIVAREGRGKPITSELGNVSPTIVLPGEWSGRAVRFQAESIVTQKMHNAGFNCIAAQVLVLPEEWNRTPALIAAIEDVLRTLPDRPAYYPGAADRCARLTTHADVRRYGGAATGFTPRSLVFADPEADDPIFRNEVFGSALAVVQIPGDIDTYLRRATAFANERLWGTLGANLIADPRTLRTHESAVDQAIADLRYGCVAVNAWTGVGYFLNETPWGAFPGHTLEDIGSGIGVVHNSHLFSRSQKSVVYAPFLQFPKPPWFVTNRQAAGIGKALCGFEVNKNPLTAAKIAMLAMSG